jgi:histidinol-phosphate aminotransferase
MSDEVYHHFVDRDDYPNSLQYVLDGRNIVIIHSFSKAYGLAGLRLGYGIAKPEIANYISSLHRGFHHSTIGLAAGRAAVLDQDYLKEGVRLLKVEMDWLIAQFKRLDICYWPPAANFVLFETQFSAADLTEKMMAYGVLVRPQQKNGLQCGVRVSAGTREANEAFISALEEIIR